MAKKHEAAKKTEAVKKRTVNKSETVRDYLKAHPSTANKDIAEALTKQGIKITANHVANIKSKMAAGGDEGINDRRSRPHCFSTGAGYGTDFQGFHPKFLHCSFPYTEFIVQENYFAAFICP